MEIKIPFNKPYIIGAEIEYIKASVNKLKISGDGFFNQKCHEFFEQNYGFKKVFLTTSCTDALEMSALLIDIRPGEEIIMPSYTFVSTANAFALRGAKIIFCDSRLDHPGIDEEAIESLITSKTKAIVCVHYAGVACNMEKLMNLAKKYNIYVIEDAAQAIDSYYTFSDGTTKPLGGIGHLGTFSFHETKNVISGEGGLLIVNDDKFIERAEIIREKGTNRSKFFRGEINKYGWVDLGSSFLPSDITGAFLYGQLENIDKIQGKRKAIFKKYENSLYFLEDIGIKMPYTPSYSSNNAHMFYLVCNNLEQRNDLITFFKEKGILAVFHYISLDKSDFFRENYPELSDRYLPNSDKYTDCLLRLPLFYTLSESELEYIVNSLVEYRKLRD